MKDEQIPITSCPHKPKVTIKTFSVAELKKKCNSIVTQVCNDIPHITKTQLQFLKKCVEFNMKEQDAFCYWDFNLKPGTFRQRVNRLKPYIETVTPGRPTFYKITGIELSGNSHSVTPRPMGDAKNLIKILETLKDQPPKIHDIKIKVQADIHTPLKEKGCTINTHNHSILIKDIPIHDNNITIKALVYPKTIQIDVGCTFKPIIFDIPSLQDLSETLKEVSTHLEYLSGVELPRIRQWIVTHYHFNKDGSVEINGQDFHYSFANVHTELMRLYSKQMLDGKKILRVEQAQSPNKSLPELMQEILASSTKRQT